MRTTRLSVIVVDKHPLMRTALSATLSSAENLAVVAEYTTCNDLLENARSTSPNMIFLGIGNPGNDELAMIQTLRTSFPATRILALITGELQGQEQIALQYGAHSVLVKSLSRTELLNKLQEQFIH